MKKKLSPIVFIGLLGMLVSNFPALAITSAPGGASSNIPECQFSGPPSAEQLQACQNAASQQAGSQSGTTNTPPGGQTAPNTPPTASGDGWEIRNNTCTYASPNLTSAQLQPCLDKLKELSGGMMPTSGTSPSMPAGTPDLSKMDFSKFGTPPEFVPGGPMPEFMGKAMDGPGADEMAGKLGGALESIKDGLTQAEEGIADMKDGQIKVDPAMEKSVKSARVIYNEAVQLFQTGDYMAVATKLGELEKVGFSKKFENFSDTQGISLDLLKDIRIKINGALKEISQIDDQESQLEAQADIMAQLSILDETEKLLKAGKKKEAMAMLKKMKKQDGGGQAEADMAGGKASIPASYISKILDKINEGLTRAGKGLEKSKAMGIEAPAELTALIDKAKSLYDAAKQNFDSGNNAKATEIIRQIQDLNLKKMSMAYRDKMLPKDRLKMILDEMKNGSKALKISITKAKEYGVDTTELEQLSVQLDDLITKAEVAYNQGDTELFLTIADKADELNVRDKVDAAIRKVADGRAKELLGEGLTAVNAATLSLTNGIAQLAAAKGKTDNAQKLLDEAKKMVASAQAAYDAEKYMDGGRFLDEAITVLIRIGNILTDTGLKLTADQSGDLSALSKITTRTDDLINTSSSDKAKAFFDNAQKNNALDVKQFLMQLNPDLMDKVITYREKDKNIIDDVIKEVIPLVPEKDQEAMLQGKINLLDEAKSADKTLAVMKQVKGTSKDTIAQMQEINKQMKEFNFTPKIADQLDQKMEELNNKIQSGETKDPKMIANYVSIMKDEIKKDMTSSQEQKFRANIVPARNITDTNPQYEEIKYLKDDGAIKPDKKGEIDLTQKISGQALTDMLNKTIDSKISNKIPNGNLTVEQATKSVFEAYNVKPNVDMKNPNQLAGFLNKMGADIKPADMKQKADLADVAEILAAADQRWGQNQ